MNIFNKYNYKDILQVDGAFAAVHANYGKSPVFNGTEGKLIVKSSTKHINPIKGMAADIFNYVRSFDGTEKDLKKDDKLLLWKYYWMEYVNVFDKLSDLLPNSVVTIFIGRQAIEIGFKYLLIKKDGHVEPTHDLGELSKLFFDKYKINASYMEWVREFCECYCKYIEGGNAEYFRYPEYKKNVYFAGNLLDITWLIYNFALIILKLIHFAGLEAEFQNDN